MTRAAVLVIYKTMANFLPFFLITRLKLRLADKWSKRRYYKGYLLVYCFKIELSDNSTREVIVECLHSISELQCNHESYYNDRDQKLTESWSSRFITNFMDVLRLY